MTQGILHEQDFQLRFKKGTRANLEKKATVLLSIQGEPFYTTDGYQLFISDGSEMRPVQSLDMAVMVENEVVSLDNEVVYSY